MSEEDKLEILKNGTVLNLTLADKWEKFFRVEDELNIMKQELVIESIRAKANKQKIPGVSVRKGSHRKSNKGIKAIFEKKKWKIPMKPKEVEDYAAMEQKLKDNDISIPYTEGSPSVNKKKEK